MNHAPSDPDGLGPGPTESARRGTQERSRDPRSLESWSADGQAALDAGTSSGLVRGFRPASLTASPGASPLELLLGPNLGLRSLGSSPLGNPSVSSPSVSSPAQGRAVGPDNSELGNSGLGNSGPVNSSLGNSSLGSLSLSNLGQLQLMQLLEVPELPAYRLSHRRSDGASAEAPETPSAEWATRPPSERGRHEALPAPLPAEGGAGELPPALPRPYVLGPADEETVDASLRALSAHETELPDIGSSAHLRLVVELGTGEATFLNARSALWSWRPHRQAGVKVHTHGPPVVGRDVLLEQRAGPVTVLQGCRVLTLQESDHDWGFTLGSLDGQVYHLWERLLIERHSDDRVALLISSHHEVALRGFGLVGGLLNSVRRSAVQGYARGMSALTEL